MGETGEPPVPGVSGVRRVVWFILGVLPGHVLILMHSRLLTARGHPLTALLPVTFYRVAGFVLTTVVLSLLNTVATLSAGGS